ncbi:MAG: alpha/beta fold hydrolase [Nitrosomonadales bacterium]|nr:alpha/beta fold hydrolase [Nitrosomonadales bacterium]
MMQQQESAPPRLEARHSVSGLNSRFQGGQLAFADYIASCREMIARAHAGTDAATQQKIVDGNAPFELEPTIATSRKRGILLTHGLSDSPYFMRHLAAFFQTQGFRVMAVLLPGHGTQPGDLLDVTWQEWARTVQYGADRLAAEVDELYLGGLSTGAALSVYHSQHDERVRGLFLFSPALKITARARWANLHKLYSWLMPSAQWVGILPDRDLYKYESFPRNAAAQMYALTQAIKGCEPNIPVFAAASLDDATVDVSATLEFMARAHHARNKLVLYASAAAALPANIPAAKLEWVNSALPDNKILSSAHTAIVLPPEDTHYGAAGEYVNCNHYYPHDQEKYAACIQHPDAAWQGEITPANLEVGMLRRLMFNPNYAALEDSMKRFVESLL